MTKRRRLTCLEEEAQHDYYKRSFRDD